MNSLESIYQQAIEQYGLDAANRAAEISVEYYNANAIAGFSPEICEAEQIAAFQEALKEDLK